MTVAGNNGHDVPGSGQRHQADFEDENGWTPVYSVGQGTSQSKLPVSFKYEFTSGKSNEARHRIGRRCMNCVVRCNFCLPVTAITSTTSSHHCRVWHRPCGRGQRALALRERQDAAQIRAKPSAQRCSHHYSVSTT